MSYPWKSFSSLDALLHKQASAYPENIFLQHEEERWTYAEAEHEVEALATGLQGLGIEQGDRFAIILPNIPAFVLALFAGSRVGAILVPIYVRRSPAEVLTRLSKTRPKAVLTSSDASIGEDDNHLEMLLDMHGDIPDVEHIITLEKEGPGIVPWSELKVQQESLKTGKRKPNDPAAIVHTLGSTGDPRGAILTHGGLLRNAAGIAETLACTQDDIFLGAVPFSNTFGLTATILACAVSGAQLVSMKRYNPAKALDLIEAAGITVHHGVPTMFALELNNPSFRPETCATLRTGIMSGAHCPPELVSSVREQMGCDVILAYGLAEASPSVTMTSLNDGPITATETVGRPMDGVEIKVIGAAGETLPPDEEGELCVRGYNVMLGYWEDDEATTQAIDKDGWLHTGDLAVITPDGPVRILGRKDEVINRGGFSIHPGTVEMVLRSHPGVKTAAVVGVPDSIYGEIACACIVRSPNADLEAEELIEFASERLANYAVPDRVLFFETLPRDGRGLVRRDYLRARVRIRGTAWKFGKNIDTDAIIPARHCNTSDPRELAKHCMEDADPTFVHKIRRGDLIVAGSNFGCGSSREVAPLSIKSAGVSTVIAKSFARIFFRNAINIGLPILESEEAVDGIQEGDEVEVEPATGIIRNLTRGTTFQAAPYPEFLQRIIQRGGLLSYVEDRLAQKEIDLGSKAEVQGT
jgi:fatty-acyl-CoA synthase